MAEDDGFDIDPAIAEAMGFTGFGMQPGKKRKFDMDDGFVDPSVKQEIAPADVQSKGKSANSVPLGTRTAQGPMGVGDPPPLRAPGGDVLPTHPHTTSTAPQAPNAGPRAGGSSVQTDLQALRHGVKNERGDMVYFLPSFIQDPWKDLQPRPSALTPRHPRLPEARAYIEGLFNYTFRDVHLLEEALCACPGAVGVRWLVDGNKSLAVVGDAALDLVVVDDCYAQGMSRGDANDRKKKLVCNDNLAELEPAKALQQQNFLQLSGGLMAVSPYMRATAVEAVIGAVFRDSDKELAAVRRAVVSFGVLEE